MKLTNDIGLERQAHIVFGLSEVDLDTGRKYLSDEALQRAVDKVGVFVMTRLKEFEWALKTENRPDFAASLEAWVESVESRVGKSIIPKVFESRGLKPPARVNPEEEQEVVALWTALVATGLLEGFDMKAISGVQRYDGLVDLTKAAFASKSLLGPVRTNAKPADNALLEFKVSLKALMKDFDEGVKMANEIDLVVCWECSELSLGRGVLHPTYGKRWSDERTIVGGSYVYRDQASPRVEFPVIALRNATAEILADTGDASGEKELALLEDRDYEQAS